MFPILGTVKPCSPTREQALVRRQYPTRWLTYPLRAGIFNQMVERLDTTFAALADPTRRAMLASLALGERSIGELAAPHAMSFAGASKPVRTLERAGLVERRKVGRSQLCRLRAVPLGESHSLISPVLGV